MTTSGRASERGDGAVFVSTIEDAVRIRNGERGDRALWHMLRPGCRPSRSEMRREDLTPYLGTDCTLGLS